MGASFDCVNCSDVAAVQHDPDRVSFMSCLGRTLRKYAFTMAYLWLWYGFSAPFPGLCQEGQIWLACIDARVL